jgi:hypothetical protein
VSLCRTCVNHLFVLPALLLYSQTISAQVSPTPTVAEGDPNYAYNWAQWLNTQMPQAIPQETISLGALQWTSLAGVPTGTPGEYGAHMTWTGLSTIKAPSTCSPLVPPGVSVQAAVVPINSYNEEYQILIAAPEPGWSPNGPNTAVHRTQLKVVLSVPTLGGPPELHEATMEPVSNQSLFAGAILATITFHPRTSLPQKLYISWFATDALSQGAGGVQVGPGGNPATNASPTEKAEACYTIIPYLKPQLGGFVVPYLPVTIVYQPAGCGTVPNTNPAVIGGSSAVFTTTAQVGTTFSWENLKTSGSIQTDNPADFFEHVKDATDGASFVASLIPGGQPVADALDKVGKVIDALNKILPNTKTTITSTSTQGHSETQGWVISSSQGYGTQVCNPEDRYVYMSNVLFVYAVVPKDPVSKQFTPTGIPTVILAPIHFDAPVNADLLSDLQRNVPPDVLAQFLALRAQVPTKISSGAGKEMPSASRNLGPASSVGLKLGPPRLVPWPPLQQAPESPGSSDESLSKCPADAPDYVEFGNQSIVSYELSETTTTTTVKEVTGFIAQLMGQAGSTTQSLTVTGAKNNWLSYGTDSKLTLQCPEIAPNYEAKEMDVWFDTVMGTLLAVPNGKLDPYGQQPQIQGSASPNTEVALKIGRRRYRVASDAQGNYAFKFASIPKGAGVLVADGETLPITYNGTPLINQNFRNASRVVATSIPVSSSARPTAWANSVPGAQPQRPGPCCSVTAVNAGTGVVAAKVTSTGQIFEFTLVDRAQLHSLQVGQHVYANFSNKQVSIDGQHPAGQVVRVLPSPGIGTPPSPAVGSESNNPGNISAQQSVGAASSLPAPCCEVVGIDGGTGVIIGKVNATGQQFQFTLSNPAQLRSVQVGQPVYANLSAKKVSLDGQKVAGSIVRVANAGVTEPASDSGGTQKSNNAAQSPQSGTNAFPGREQFAFVHVIDPCTVAPVDQLRAFATAGVAKAFPFTSSDDGKTVTVYDPHVASVTCLPLHIGIDAKVHFKQTRSFPQFESHGTMSFDSIIVGEIVSLGPPSQSVSTANFQSAKLCFTDIHVDTFNLKNVPNFYDNWIREGLNQRLTSKEQCIDITALISAFLATGATISPQPQPANSTGPTGFVKKP